MNREDIGKLLGGYATGTLTAEEREALMAAALDDQTLFDALADEQALRDLLADPAARAHLLAALGESRPGLAARLAAWWRKPAVMALAASVMAGAVALTVMRMSRPPVPDRPVQVALVRQPPLPEAAAPPAAAAPPPASVAAIAPAPEKPLAAKRKERHAAEPEPVPRQFRDMRPPPPPPPAMAPPPPPAASAEGTAKLEARADKLAAPPPAGVGGGVIGGVFGGVIGGVPGVSPPPPPALQAAAGAARSNGPRMLARTALVAARGPAVGYTLLRQSETGAYEPLAAGSEVHTGDVVALRVEPREAGWLYVLAFREGVWQVIFSGKAEPGRTYAAPSAGSLRYTDPGRKQLAVVLATEEIPGGPAAPPANAIRITVDVVVQ